MSNDFMILLWIRVQSQSTCFHLKRRWGNIQLLKICRSV